MARTSQERVTIADVAREANVSTMTVSRVVNGKGETSEATRAKVQEVVTRLGYRPNGLARSLTLQRTFTLGFVVPDISNPFFPDIVRGAEDAAWQAGYTLVLCSTVESVKREEKVLQLLEDKHVDGVIVCSARLPDEQLFPLIERHSAALLVNRRAPQEVASTLRVHDAQGTMRAVHHLLSRGKEALALLAGPSYSYSAERRFEGFETALETTGREVDKALIRPCTPDEAGGFEAAKTLLRERPDIDGLICYNDLVAVGALQACEELGVRVPGDLAVVGCDDIRLASLVTPALTTLRVSKYDLGAQAVKMLLERIEGKAAEEMLIKPELVVRQSAP